MTTKWEIQGLGEFKDLGLSNLQRNRRTQVPDIVTFIADGKDYDSDPIIGFRDDVTILRDGTPWFQGTNLTIPVAGGPSEEAQLFRVAGAWWYLERAVYEQGWQLFNISGGLLESQFKTRVILNQKITGEKATTGEQIIDALGFAIGKGAPLQIGTIDPDVDVPFSEETDITCAEVIVRMLRWSPEVVAYFDYTTTPPTFHARKRANLVPAVIPVDEGRVLQTVVLTPRFDLIPKGVVIRFERTHEVTSGDVTTTFETVFNQVAGDPDDIETMISTIELAGTTISQLSQKIVVESLGNISSKDFWKARLPWLEGLPDADFTISNASRNGTLTNVLIEGTIQEWMLGDDPQGDPDILQEQEVVRARIDYTLRESGVEVRKVKALEVSAQILTTDAVTKTYKKNDTIDLGEDIPIGLAQQLFNAWAELQFDGEFTLVDEEVNLIVSLGNSINLTGGRSEWTTMNALIRQIVDDVDVGRTTITIGPVRHLGADELFTILRGFRNRTVPIRHQARESGRTNDVVQTMDLGGPGPEKDGSSGQNQITSLILQLTSGGSQFICDPDDLTTRFQVFQVDTSGPNKTVFDFVRAHG